MNSNAEEYRSQFNKLEEILKKKAKVPSEISVSSALSVLVKEDRVIRRFERDIRQFIELRNAIIHQSDGRAIAEPYDETVESLRQLIDSIEKPKTAWDISVNELKVVGLEDKLSDAIKLMAELHITSLPVVSDGKVLGFVSESTIIKIINKSFKQDDAILIDEKEVKDIDFDPPYGDDSDIYKYTTRRITVYEIEDMFNNAIKTGKRLLAVLVSDKGDASAAPLGIITAWDLHRIDK